MSDIEYAVITSDVIKSFDCSMYSYFLGGSTGKDRVTIGLLLACWWFNREKNGLQLWYC